MPTLKKVINNPIGSNRFSLKPLGRYIYTLLTDKTRWKTIGGLMLIFELVLGVAIIFGVNYTEIDWIAYMQEVEGVVKYHTYDYQYLRGSTGPLVYPAGFVYIYTILYYITNMGQSILLAQFIFLALYLVTLFLVFKIYAKLNVPPRVMILLCLSKRLHSIYMLRLFNDPVAMILAYLAVYLIMNHKFKRATVTLALAISVKMNVLLFLPGWLLILYISKGAISTLLHTFGIIIIQAVLGLPFLLANWRSYLKGAFDLGRQFDFKWTVNWRMIPQLNFNSPTFAHILLTIHLGMLVVFLLTCWSRWYGGLFSLIRKGLLLLPHHNSNNSPVTPQSMVLILFTCNLIGITFSRSLHYQFYSWYYHTLPFLLYTTAVVYPLWFRAILYVTIEFAWNKYPSTQLSSMGLFAAHLSLLLGLWAVQVTGNIQPMSALQSNSIKDKRNLKRE